MAKKKTKAGTSSRSAKLSQRSFTISEVSTVPRASAPSTSRRTASGAR